jgi:hypothetical protein
MIHDRYWYLLMIVIIRRHLDNYSNYSQGNQSKKKNLVPGTGTPEISPFETTWYVVVVVVLVPVIHMVVLHTLVLM